MSKTPLAPDDPRHANLVDTLTGEERRKIASEIVEDYDNDVSDRKPWEEKRDRFYKLWVCHRDPKTTPFPDASNVCLPILSIACNQFHGRAYNAFFSPPRFVKAIPVGESDKNHAKNVENYMDWQMRHDMPDYEEEMDKLLLNTSIGGTNFKKLYWDASHNRPVAEYVSGVDLVVPYKTKKLSSARRKTHRLWLHYDELEERNDRGLYSGFDLIAKGGQTIQSDIPKERTQDKVVHATSRQDENPELILECHKKKKIKVDGKMKSYIFTVSHKDRVLLRMIEAQTMSGNKEDVLDYFIDYHFIPNPEGYYSFGFGHFLEVVNEIANTAFNQIFDAGRLSNMPWGFYGRRAGIKKQKIKLHPGAMNEIEDATQIVFPQMQRMDQTLFQVIGFIQNYSEQFSGTSDFLMGRFPKGLKAPTTGSTLGVIEQGLIQFSILTKRLFRSFGKELGVIYELNKLYLPETKQFVVMEGEDDIAWPEIKRAEFQSRRHVIPVGDPTFASKAQRLQEAQEMYGFLIQNPLVGFQDPKLGQLQNPPAIHEATKDVIEAYNNKRMAKLLPKLPEQPMDPGEENALYIQGDTSTPKPGEDHIFHLATHEGFRTTKHYKAMPADYKKAFDRHIKVTKALQFLEARSKESFLAQNDQTDTGLLNGLPGSGSPSPIQPPSGGSEAPAGGPISGGTAAPPPPNGAGGPLV